MLERLCTIKMASQQTYSDLTFRVLTIEDFDMAFEFVLKNYTYNEPLRKIITNRLETLPEIDQERVKSKLKDNCSIGIFNKENKMVAAVFNGISTKCNASYCCLHPIMGKGTWLEYISDLVNYLEGNLFNELDISKFIMISMLAVHPDYQKRGLATELIHRCEVFGKDRGCQCIVTDASSHYSQLAFEKAGFVKLKEALYSEYIPDFKAVPPHMSAAIYYKKY